MFTKFKTKINWKKGRLNACTIFLLYNNRQRLNEDCFVFKKKQPKLNLLRIRILERSVCEHIFFYLSLCVKIAYMYTVCQSCT